MAIALNEARAIGIASRLSIPAAISALGNTGLSADLSFSYFVGR